MKAQSIGDFSTDKVRGGKGENIAKKWLKGIDFKHLPPMVNICTRNGTKANRECTEQKWDSQSENGKNDENKDFIVTFPACRECKKSEKCKRMPNNERYQERHEIKTDFRAYVDIVKSNGATDYHTERILIEVDKDNIINLEEVQKNPCYRGGKPQRAYFHSGDHADWYHFCLPLCNYDGNGNVILNSRMAAAMLTDEEIAAFDADEQISEGDSIVTEVPFAFVLAIKGDKMKELLEIHAGIKFNDEADRSSQRIHISLPVYEISKECIEENSDGRIAIIPFCQYHKKGKPNIDGGRLYMPTRLPKAITDEQPLSTPEMNFARNGKIERINIIEFVKEIYGVDVCLPGSTIFAQKELTLYTGRDGIRHEPLSTACLAYGMLPYPPNTGHNI